MTHYVRAVFTSSRYVVHPYILLRTTTSIGSAVRKMLFIIKTPDLSISRSCMISLQESRRHHHHRVHSTLRTVTRESRMHMWGERRQGRLRARARALLLFRYYYVLRLDQGESDQSVL